MGCPCEKDKTAATLLEDRLAEVERRELQTAVLVLALSVAVYFLWHQAGKD